MTGLGGHERPTDPTDGTPAGNTGDTVPNGNPAPTVSPGRGQDAGRREDGVTRHEEQAHVTTEQHETGRVRVRKHVDTFGVEETVPRNVEQADTERIAALEGDSGEVETLEDGSVSIPLFEEVVVVTKRLVVRERVIVRKSTVVDEYRLQTELRREHVSLETDGDVEVEDRRTPPGPDAP